MGCNSSKYSSEQDNAMDSKREGTTIVACFIKEGIVFGVDSRSSNEGSQGIREHSKQHTLKIRDDTDKVFRMSSNIVAVMAGEGRACRKMCESVKGECSQFLEFNDVLSVSLVYKEMIKYLEHTDNKNKEFGIIIAGWDEKDVKKGLQGCRIFISDNHIVKDEYCSYASLGSGQQHANDIMAPEYNYNMTVEDTADLVLKSLFFATLYDKYTGGTLKVYHVDKKDCHKISSHSSLVVYRKYYDLCDEKNTLFLVYSSTHQPFTADDLMTSFFRKYGITAMAGHLVGQYVSKKLKEGVALFFHRLVCRTPEASEVYKKIVAENGHKSRPCDLSIPEIYKKFDYRVELNTEVRDREVKVPVYVSRSSKELLDEMLSALKVTS